MLGSSHAQPPADIELLAYHHLFLSDFQVSRDLYGSSITLCTEISILKVFVHIRLSRLCGGFFSYLWLRQSFFIGFLLKSTGPILESVGKIKQHRCLLSLLRGFSFFQYRIFRLAYDLRRRHRDTFPNRRDILLLRKLGGSETVRDGIHFKFKYQ